jgi:hypothetical protein
MEKEALFPHNVSNERIDESQRRLFRRYKLLA